jgi:hypothetical protein
VPQAASWAQLARPRSAASAMVERLPGWLAGGRPPLVEMVAAAEQVGEVTEVAPHVAGLRPGEPDGCGRCVLGDPGADGHVDAPAAAQPGHGVDLEGCGDSQGVEGTPRGQRDAVQRQPAAGRHEAEPADADHASLIVELGGALPGHGRQHLVHGVGLQACGPGHPCHRGGLAGTGPPPSTCWRGVPSSTGSRAGTGSPRLDAAEREGAADVVEWLRGKGARSASQLGDRPATRWARGGGCRARVRR